MKVIFVVGARGIPDVEGGVEKSVERVFPRIAKRGWRVIVAGLKENINSAQYRGVELWAAPSFRFFNTDKILYYFLAIIHAFRLRPDIVHLVGLGSALFLWAYKLIGCNIVVRYGSADYVVPKWGLVGRFGFRLAEYQLRFADSIIVVTPALAKRLQSKGIAGNIHIVPNALDDINEFGDNRAPALHFRYILAVGRVSSQKNFHRLIKAFDLFSNSHEGMKLVIAGGADDREYWKQVSPLVHDNIILLGRLPRSELGSLYRDAELFINCSLHEGHSNAILEAISWQCPLLLSDIAENRDFRLDSKYFFDPENIASIAAAMARAVAHREQYRVDEAAFLTWDEVADKTEQVYYRLIDEFPAGQISECET